MERPEAKGHGLYLQCHIPTPSKYIQSLTELQVNPIDEKLLKVLRIAQINQGDNEPLAQVIKRM